MIRILTAALISFGLAMSLPLSAASKPVAKKTTKSKTKAKAKAKKAPARAGQQQPTAERTAEIQRALVDRGYLAEATGSWGTDSVAALKKFQKEQGFPVDGKIGALSLTALGLGPRRSAGTDSITAGILSAGTSPTPLD